MAGRMGGDTVTTQNLTVHAVDAEQGPDPAQGRRSRPQGWPRRRSASAAKKEPTPSDRPSTCHAKGARPARSTCPPRSSTSQVNIPLIHQVVVAQQAAARQGTHATKTRGEVRGGGRKPYKQKGTGRARQGSTRAPQFAGGGVVHGPQPRDYDQRTPKKMKAAALRGALSDRARNGRIHVVERAGRGDAPSTKAALAALAGADRPRAASSSCSSAPTRSPGSRCATRPRCTSWPSTSSTPTTCWPPTTWSSPQGALRRLRERPGGREPTDSRPKPTSRPRLEPTPSRPTPTGRADGRRDRSSDAERGGQ